MNCPDDGQPLAHDPDGSSSCRRCNGALMTKDELATLAPTMAPALTLETDEKSGAFAKLRRCPQCQGAMAPWRMRQLQAWLECCPTCELFWADPQDRTTLARLGQKRVMEDAIRALPEAERKELATHLAAMHQGEPYLSPFQKVMGAIGFPALLRLDGRRNPVATWALCLALTAVFVLGYVSPGSWAASQLAYSGQHPTARAALTSLFAHFGFWHLAGNLAFLLAFGEGVEQRLSRALYVAAFFLLGLLPTLIQGAISPESLVGGASGAVSILMGACVVLQPRASVYLVLFMWMPLRVPLLVFGIFELLYQGLMAMSGVAGVGWWAHLSGLLLGLGFGLVCRATQRTLPVMA